MNQRIFWVVALVVGCGGKLTIDRLDPGGEGAGSGGALSNGGSGPSGNGNGAAPMEPSTAGQAAETGGVTTGGFTTGGYGSSAGLYGATDPSGAPNNFPTEGEGGYGPHGGDGSGNSSGAPYCDDVTGDCHAIDCDGERAPYIDQGDVPSVDNPCLAGTCNNAGTPGTEPRDARTPCQVDGGKLCDGAGKCVPCLLSADCGPGKTCSKDHVCSAAACTDVDCGGVCPACEDGKHCVVDSDCASYACDSETQLCVADHCKDHHQSGNESDADCGGNCTKCGQGKGCLLNFDCTSNACDGIANVCDTSQCVDHHVDGDETDIDCGGVTCGIPCLIGKKCKNNFDCLSGFCGGIPKTCQ
jgi:hypothetical protein